MKSNSIEKKAAVGETAEGLSILLRKAIIFSYFRKKRGLFLLDC